jgi:hypothetical protein
MTSDDYAELGTVFNDLIKDYTTLRHSLDEIDNQSQNIRVLSFNSAIEAARAGQSGIGFRVISQEIRSISEQNKAVNDTCNKVVNGIEKKMYNLIGIRTADVAFDTVDKIDRNLFERFCDIQAWTTFAKIIDACTSSEESAKRDAEQILEQLVKIYEVYYDAFLADMNGKILCAAVHKEYDRQDVSASPWFSAAVNEGKTVYSDMYFSKSIGQWVVAYSCPIFDHSDRMVGVLSTRFNWKFVLDIIQKAKISAEGDVLLVNKQGMVIASRNQNEILKMTLTGKESFQQLKNGIMYGYCFEKDQGRSHLVYGFAHTKGYNAYPGKEWSVIIREKF